MVDLPKSFCTFLVGCVGRVGFWDTTECAVRRKSNSSKASDGIGNPTLFTPKLMQMKQFGGFRGFGRRWTLQGLKFAVKVADELNEARSTERITNFLLIENRDEQRLEDIGCNSGRILQELALSHHCPLVARG